ncbi:hypothetical protein BC940DRAFT_278250 [Gongronella butleri]|nr:hypothetical protein BC940DRAFT_278250 [Gongronella butleri]
MASNETIFSIRDARGRQCSLLNEEDATPSIHQMPASGTPPTKRRYLCQEPGCNKSFTTSGHLARHNRIHTGEKNFHCIYPGCISRFSRQDNMMQHYRTHLSPKSKRHPYHQQYTHHQQQATAYGAPYYREKYSPQLHRHTHFHSDKAHPSPLYTLHQVCDQSSVPVSLASSVSTASVAGTTPPPTPPPFASPRAIQPMSPHTASFDFSSHFSQRKPHPIVNMDATPLPLAPYQQRHQINPAHLNHDYRDPDPASGAQDRSYQLAYVGIDC